jgi:hypothetical protein
MRYLDDPIFPEVATILGLGEEAAKMRHLTAMQRIHMRIEERDGPELGP